MYNTNFTFALLHFLQMNSVLKTRIAADGCYGLFNPLHRHTYPRYIHCMSLCSLPHTSSVSLLILTGV